jgi:vitamin B12/bleomycin/antimicrobial peptide transport system ATP-binding/permease protein
LLRRLDDLVANFRKITSVNRNVGFFTTGYNWMIQIIPALIIAPAFIERKIEFGVITQSAVAFSTLVAAFSLIVTQFQSLSSYAAVVARLSALVESVGQSGDPGTEPAPQGARPFDTSITRRLVSKALSANSAKEKSIAVPIAVRPR